MFHVEHLQERDNMTRKDYEMVAGILAYARRLKTPNNPDANMGWDLAIAHITGRLAEEFGKDNPRFDHNRFFDASEMYGA